MKRKRGEITVTTIVVIVLAVAVLIFLIWGFSAGWSNAWGKITAIIGGGSNVDTIKQACILACTSGQETKYCADTTTIMKTGDGKKIKGSCATFSREGLGVESCPSINCAGKLPIKCEGEVKDDNNVGIGNLEWTDKKCKEGSDKTFERNDWGKEDYSNKKCCVPETA